MKVTVFVEVVPERRWGSIVDAHVGKTWKRRPKPEQVTPGAVVVAVGIDVPRDRLEHVVAAEVPSPAPVQIVRSA